MAMITCANVETFVKAVQDNANAYYGALSTKDNSLILTMTYTNVGDKVNCPFYKAYKIIEELGAEKRLAFNDNGIGLKQITAHVVKFKIIMQDDWYVRAVLNDAYPHLKLEDKSFISGIIKKAIHAANFRTVDEWKQEADFQMWNGCF